MIDFSVNLRESFLIDSPIVINFLVNLAWESFFICLLIVREDKAGYDAAPVHHYRHVREHDGAGPQAHQVSHQLNTATAARYPLSPQ